MPEDKRAPLVGQFSGPTGNAPRTPVELPRKSPMTSDAPESSKKEEEKREDVTTESGKAPAENRPKTPQEKAQDYKKGLEEVGVSEQEARIILEKVLIHDVYEETGKIGPITVTVRTRNYVDALRAMRYLELEKPMYAMGINDVVARYNMAASLSAWGDRVFTHPEKKNKASTEEIESAFDERLEFIMHLPTVAYDRLQQLMHAFDGKISAVFAEGSPEDF
jgi:hypothetical protein